MRIVFCGSGEVAVPTLEALRQAGHELLSVITQPPRPAGRGGRLTPTPLDAAARRLGLPLVETPNINHPEVVEALRRLGPELIVVVDFGQKVGAAVRACAALEAVNLHASLLPELRGAAPISWAIIRGLATTGLTTFRLVDKMDAGPVLLQQAVTIDPEETAEELRERLARLGADVVLRTVAGLGDGTLRPVEQDHTLATLAPKLAKSEGRVDFAAGAVAVANRIRGTWPWPGVHADFVHAGRPPVRVILARARAILIAEPQAAEGGTLADDLTLHAAGGRVQVLQLQVAGKRLTAWRDFINGYHVSPGDRFVSVAPT